MRGDLTVREQTYQGRRFWVIKDPLALKYYRFEQEEISILEMLDGQSSLEEIQRQFEARFAPQKITLQELHQLVGMLHRAALVVSDAPGQGEQLLERSCQSRNKERLARLTNILSVRFKGFDPDWLLTRLDRLCGWYFSRPSLASTLLLACGALLLIATQFDQFQAKLPAFQDFFASQNWIWLAVALGLTKVLHEFGHGLACKRFGGECHEMGVMLLILTPCLYCNVSDSWLLPNKWHRAAIGAAGMYVELTLASICTFLWWFTYPGLLHYLCLNVMVVCSVSTLLFNANPLLRYDGYYILSDLLEIPNLRQKADAILRRKLGAWLCGLPEQPDPFLPRRRQVLFATFAIAATVYKWLVTLAILWFLQGVFEPYGLRVVGQALACFVIVGMVVQPLWQLAQFLRVPGRIDRVKKPRVAMSGAVGMVLLAAVWFVPIPFHVRCSLYLQPRDASSVYVESAGSLSRILARPGDWVDAGQPMIALENIDVAVEIEQLRGERQRLESRLASLRQRAFDDEQAAGEISEVEQMLAATDEQIAAREQDERKLTIAAPAAGVVIPSPAILAGNRDPGRLPTWAGTPFDERNRRAFLAEGVAICQVGDPNRLEAILMIDERDVEFLHPGQTVDLFLEPVPGRRFRSRVEQLSQVDMKVAPRNLSSKSGGELLARTDSAGLDRPLNTTYQANAFLDDETGLLLVGATGQGKIHARPQTLAQRLWRYLCHTFHFDV
jgi:putative peptide zinc metalloprotease protein